MTLRSLSEIGQDVRGWIGDSTQRFRTEFVDGGDVWVLKLAAAVPDAALATLASQLETDASVQYADPVRRVRAQRVPNDPRFGSQWALTETVGGINAPAAWDLQIGSAAMTVAVIDTGITQHPELSGRVLPGYDFISDPYSAKDGNGRDNDPSDPGA